ncbi:competence protein ComK [Bacillaceae bacterium W0354]
MEFVEKPTINSDTLAVVPYQISKDLYGSYVLETQKDYYTHLSPKQLVDSSCQYFGASLQGRLAGTRAVFGVNRKPPISIEPNCGLFFLPTNSPNSVDCIWLAHSHIDYLERIKPKQTKVHFNSGKQLVIDISYVSLNNQIQRTAQYRHLLLERLFNHQK